MEKINDKNTLAFIIGAAIGDGNLSNPNGRALRLRITCDNKYGNIINRLIDSIKKTLPHNKVSLIKRKDNCVDISCYSNRWKNLLGWEVGSKFQQKIRIPEWIKNNKKYITYCLKGLFETDGSIYFDRKYKMVNFTTTIPNIAQDVCFIIKEIGFKPNLQKSLQKSGKIKYVIRVAKNADDFINCTGINKS